MIETMFRLRTTGNVYLGSPSVSTAQSLDGIDLTRRRVNARVSILRFDGETMTRVDEVTVGAEHR